MDYIQEAFARMNLTQIHNFILCGAGDFGEDHQSYKDRLKDGTTPIYNRLREIYPDDADWQKADRELTDVLSAYEQVYMELGMKAGARLVYQLLLADD